MYLFEQNVINHALGSPGIKSINRNRIENCTFATQEAWRGFAITWTRIRPAAYRRTRLHAGGALVV